MVILTIDTEKPIFILGYGEIIGQSNLLRYIIDL